MTFSVPPLPQGCARICTRWLGLLLLVVATGCGAQHGCLTARPVSATAVAVQPVAMVAADPRAAQAALDEARRLDRRDDPTAVDYYFQAAVLSAGGITPAGPADQSDSIYRQALWGLVDSGQRLGRLDPRSGLTVMHGGQRTVPIRYFGFAFSRATSAGCRRRTFRPARSPSATFGRASAFRCSANASCRARKLFLRHGNRSP